MSNLITHAHTRGSTATTVAGARRYLRQRIRESVPSPWVERICLGGQTPLRLTAGRVPYQYPDHQRRQIERRADGRARVLGYPAASEIYEQYVAAYREDSVRSALLTELQVGRWPRAATPQEANASLQGYERGYRCQIDTPSGTLLLHRLEDVEWDDRRRSRWPSRVTVSYSARLVSPSGAVLAQATFNRRGNWFGPLVSKLTAQSLRITTPQPQRRTQ